MIMKLSWMGGTLRKIFMCLELHLIRFKLIISFSVQVYPPVGSSYSNTVHINSCGTQKLKLVHLIPDYHDHSNYLQSGTVKTKIVSRELDVI